MATVLGLLLGVASASAGDQPCRVDLDRFCKGVPRGEGRLRECVKAHMAELSPACRDKLESLRRILAQYTDAGPGEAVAAERPGARVLRACREDLDRYCAGVPSGQGRRRQCLRARAPELTDECRRALGPPPS